MMSWHGNRGLTDNSGREINPPYKVFRDMGNGRKPYDAFPNPHAAYDAAVQAVGRCYGIEITGNCAGNEVVWLRADMKGNAQFFTSWRP